MAVPGTVRMAQVLVAMYAVSLFGRCIATLHSIENFPRFIDHDVVGIGQDIAEIRVLAIGLIVVSVMLALCIEKVGQGERVARALVTTVFTIWLIVGTILTWFGIFLVVDMGVALAVLYCTWWNEPAAAWFKTE